MPKIRSRAFVRRATWPGLWLGLAVLVAGGCQSGGNADTGMGAESESDRVATTLVQRFKRVPAIAERTRDSEPWLIAVDRAGNLTPSAIAPDERWAFIDRVRDHPAMRAFCDATSIRFVLRGEGSTGADSSAAADDEPATERATHSLVAIFRSQRMSRAGDDQRRHYCQLSLMDLRTGQPVWAGEVPMAGPRLTRRGSLRASPGG